MLVSTLDMRGIWIPRWSIDDHQRIFATLDGKFNHIFLQVYALGEAYYPSRIVPARRKDDTWLKDFLREAHRRNIKVSAWINAFYAWGFAPPTRDQRHPINLHPNWFVEDRAGGSILGLGTEEMRNQGIEGYYLAPGNEQVRSHLFSIIDELLDMYEFDGIHLDYCRYPAPRFVYDVALRSKFMRIYCLDPKMFSASDSEQRFGTWGHNDLEMCWQEFVRDDLTQFVRALHDHMRVKKPGVSMSVAVKADQRSARRDFFQDWPEWINSGLVDFVCLMAYSNDIENTLNETLKLVKYPHRIAVGLGIYRLTPDRIRAQVRQVSAMPFEGVVFFSYEEFKKNTAFRYVLD
jgi:uncharacterized lipoprotein YddW (UPF0748 family)